MEFGIKRCAILLLKNKVKESNRKKRNTQASGLLQKRKIANFLGILEVDTIRQRWKKKTWKEFLGRTRKLLKTMFSSSNLIKWINTWVVSLVRYSGLFLNWTREDLRLLDQRTRKLMTIHNALYPRDDIDRRYDKKERWTRIHKDRGRRGRSNIRARRIYKGQRLIATNRNSNNKRTLKKNKNLVSKVERKTTVWLLQETY